MLNTESVHLSMPPELQKFALFGRLPFDIRYQIWKRAIYVPGIHFLKFERANPATDDGSSEEDEREREGTEGEGEKVSKEPKVQLSSRLVPIFPIKAADTSYYITASKTLTQLSLTCQEAAEMVTKATTKPGALVLDSGRLITLQGSSDVICIDYPDLCYTRGLGRWAETLDMQQLSNIRRLAVRYLAEWDEGARTCRSCGRVHESTRKLPPRRHLFEFAALFPNLESFYFVDYLTVRKPKDRLEGHQEKDDNPWLGPDVRRKMITLRQEDLGKCERFASGGRTYFEANPDLCKVNTNVFASLAWVQESYVEYCTEHPGKHENPEKVKFGVLACEWEMPRANLKKRRIAAAGERRATRDSKRGSPIDDAFRDLNLEDQRRCAVFERPTTCPVRFGDQGASSFDFTFSKPFSS